MIDILPMLAVPGTLGDVRRGHAYEFKWDGVRALAQLRGGEWSLASRQGNDITARYPEVAALSDDLADDTILDGEIVALDERARPSFSRLQHRMHLAEPGRVAAAAATTPVVFMVFDLLRDGGESLLDHPYEQRRERLLDLGLGGAHWQTPPHGAVYEEVLAAAMHLELEGLVAKRLGSPYRPGVRSPNWRKIRLMQRQEFVVAGWLPGEGGRAGSFGSLVIGYHDDDGHLRYAGRVGSGFRDRDLAAYQPVLDELVVVDCPFHDAGVAEAVGAEVRWVQPHLVIEVQFKEWTPDGVLRAPSYKGFRADKDASEVVRET